ncbi:MAG: hypothetical protein ACFFDN_05245 [Candidatus Hodarchaeota archaeon]
MNIYVTIKPKCSINSLQNKVSLHCDENESFEKVALEFLRDVAKQNNFSLEMLTYEIFIRNDNKYYQLIPDEN